METALCMSGFLLLVFITAVHTDPHYMFKQEGGSAEIELFWQVSLLDYCVLYRVHSNGNLLLINCSQTDRPPPEGYNVECVHGTTFVMNNLTLSQCGDYKVVKWRDKNIVEERSVHLTVCAEREEPSKEEVMYDDDIVLCRLDPTLHGTSLQLYRYNWYDIKTILVLDTNSSLEPLVCDLRGRLQVDLINSQVRLSGVTKADEKVHCVTWRGTECLSYSQRTLRMFHKKVFAHEEENVTLPCTGKRESPSAMLWSTPNWGVRLSSSRRDQYMLNGSQTGDYSLIIPSVSPQHSGEYSCFGRHPIKFIMLYVCTKVSPLDVMFSHSESVILERSAGLNGSWTLKGVQWYRQKVLQPQVLILEFNRDYNKSVFMPEDLRDKVSSFHPNYSLTISNLIAENSGVYMWRVYGRDAKKNRVKVCYEGEIRLVYRDPFGVHSPFYRVYAPLMGCVLLGLVTAVIWFNLRSRRGEQTSGRQSREGQQSGDEDVYDEVEMAEDSA